MKALDLILRVFLCFLSVARCLGPALKPPEIGESIIIFISGFISGPLCKNQIKPADKIGVISGSSEHHNYRLCVFISFFQLSSSLSLSLVEFQLEVIFPSLLKNKEWVFGLYSYD